MCGGKDKSFDITCQTNVYLQKNLLMVLFFSLRDEPLLLLFHWKKNRLNIYLLTNTITFMKYFKSYEVPQINDRFLSEPLIVL